MNASVRSRRRLVVPVLAVAALAACGGGGGGGDGAVPMPLPDSPASVSGTVDVIDDAIADSDVNDPAAPYAPNDEPEQAQPIRNPSTVGGYANRAGEGPPGRSHDGGDAVDAFRVPLAAGETVNLYVADPAGGDLDLFLLDGTQRLVDSSEGTGHDESVTAPRDGAYFVLVTADRGASQYLLQAGAIAETASHAMRYEAAFVPGEIVAAFVEPKAVRALGASAAQRAAALGLVARGGAPGRPMRFALPSAGIPAALEAPAPKGTRWRDALEETSARRMTLRAIKALARRDDVEFAEPNLLRRPLATPNDPHFGQQWHYDLINLPAAWDLTRGSPDVIVAIIDTGVVLDHPDLAGQFDPHDRDGVDFISDPVNARDGSGVDQDANDPGDGVWGGDSTFHGTHVAGTVAAATDNAFGVAGAAWRSRLMPLRVLGGSGGSSYDIQQAVLYAAGLPNDTGLTPARRADVLNLSLGGSHRSLAEERVYRRAMDAGVLIAAAAGNDGNTQLSYPASYDAVVSVAATDRARRKAPYSQHNSAVDVAAPGGDQSVSSWDGVLSTRANDSSGRTVPTYAYLQGTSMATPHIAGVMALMRAVHPALTQRDFLELLAAGRITSDLGDAGRDNAFGWGLIDARRAVEAARALVGDPPPPPNPVLATSTESLQFGTATTTLFFDLRNGGSGTLTVTSVTDDQPWLVVSADEVDGNGLGRYRVTVDRSGLAAGFYEAVITAQSTANSVRIAVTLQVETAPLPGDAGFTYVLLVDSATHLAVAQVQGDTASGRLPFTFAAVRPGSYYLVAGSDLDNDGFVCDAGESCGAYPTASQPEALEIGDGSRTGLQLLTGFLFRINAGPPTARADGTDAPGWRRLR